MTYKSVIDLVPQTMPLPEYLRVASRTRERFGSLAFSLDDAFGMISGGNADSYFRVWHYNEFSAADQERLVESAFTLKFMALNTLKPYVWDIAHDLPTGGDGYGTRKLGGIRTATIHHTVGWRYDATNFANAFSIASYHVNTKEWPGIGYHFLIPPDGEIMQTNAIDIQSYHAGSYSAPGDENEWSIGVCFGGDFRQGAAPTEYQLSVGRSLIAQLRRDLDSHVNVIPHKHMPGASTVCPGDNPDPWLKILNYG